jgi:serine/threonine-protein kinase
MTLEEGHVLKNRYRIQRVLGEGGMGTVYMAQDLLLDRPRAIKELYPDPLADEAELHQARLQFECEAKALKKLRHPSLPHVSDYFSVDEYDYLVMDYVEGPSLADILASKKRPTESTAYEWLNQISDVLAYCHQNQIIHRDIKPANLIRTPDKRIVLVDFGLVKMMDPHNPDSETIVSGVGTPQYTPLEQYDAHRARTDVRSDIYALGATFYHLLTGQAPQPVSQRLLNPSAQPAIRELNPRISPWMADFVQKAMAIRPEERFQDTQELRRELETRLFKLKAQPKAAAKTSAAARLTPSRRQASRTAPHRRRAASQKPQGAVADPLPKFQGAQQAQTPAQPQVAQVREGSVSEPSAAQGTTPTTAPHRQSTDLTSSTALPMVIPMAVIFVMAVVVSIVFATGSSLATVTIVAPLLFTAWVYHRLRSARNNKRPPGF